MIRRTGPKHRPPFLSRRTTENHTQGTTPHATPHHSPTALPQDIEFRLPRHAKVSPGREIRARCALDGNSRLPISVTHANDTLPAPREAAPEDESARGLALVEALADDWGTDPRPGGIGKTVWFELGLDSEARAEM